MCCMCEKGLCVMFSSEIKHQKGSGLCSRHPGVDRSSVDQMRGPVPDSSWTITSPAQNCLNSEVSTTKSLFTPAETTFSWSFIPHAHCDEDNNWLLSHFRFGFLGSEAARSSCSCSHSSEPHDGSVYNSVPFNTCVLLKYVSCLFCTIIYCKVSLLWDVSSYIYINDNKIHENQTPWSLCFLFI